MLQEQLNQVKDEVNANKVKIEKFAEIFKETCNLLKNGKLSSTKSIIEIFVDKVLVFEDHINVLFKYHQDLELKV